MMYMMYVSGWIIACFSAERALVVHFPLKMAPILTTKIRRRVVACIMIMGAPMFLITMLLKPVYFPEGQTETKACLAPNDTDKLLLYIIIIITCGFSSLFPSLVVAFINIIILIGVNRASKNRDKMSAVSSDSSSSQERRCTRNLIIISGFYLLFMLPFGLLWSTSLLLPTLDVYIHPYVYTLAVYALTWSLLNYCTNPILYSFSLPFYRKEALNILTCGRRAKNAH